MLFIIWIVVGGILGWLASLVMKTDAEQGMILNVVVGIVGAFLLDPARLRESTLLEAEQAGRTASSLRWFALQYPDVGGVTIELAAALEDTAAARVVARLRVVVSDPTIGRCRRCGKTCAPWFPLCDRCFGRA